VWNFLCPRTRGRIVSATYVLKSFITAIAMLLFVFLAVPAHAEKGLSSYKQGRDMEARQNYESAYDVYQRAYDADPRNTQYRAAVTRIRFLAAASKVHRATLLQQAGKLPRSRCRFLHTWLYILALHRRCTHH
jgi:tetratricopeptide (TPR) repeat protein